MTGPCWSRRGASRGTRSPRRTSCEWTSTATRSKAAGRSRPPFRCTSSSTKHARTRRSSCTTTRAGAPSGRICIGPRRSTTRLESMVPEDPVLYDDFNGGVTRSRTPRRASRRWVTAAWPCWPITACSSWARDIAQAHHRSVVLEWRCRQAWHVEAIGNGVAVKDEVFKKFAAPFDYVSFPGLFEAMVRRELRRRPVDPCRAR